MYGNKQASEYEFSDESFLKIKGLSVSIGETTVLEKVSLDLSANQVLAIIGTSGCGKSILLKSIVGLIREEFDNVNLQGKVEFHGRDITNLVGDEQELLRQKIVYLSQDPKVFNLSIYENISYVIEYWRSRLPTFFSSIDSGKTMNELVEFYLHRANLWNEVKDRLKLNALTLSTGQQQRLCLARALALEPEILLLDEPAAHLDHIAMRKLEESMVELSEGKAIIIVTHSMQQAARTSQRTAQMRYQAGIIELNDTEKIFTNPQHQLTEEFIIGRIG